MTGHDERVRREAQEQRLRQEKRDDRIMAAAFTGIVLVVAAVISFTIWRFVP